MNKDIVQSNGMEVSAQVAARIMEAGEGMALRIGTVETVDLPRVYGELCTVGNALDTANRVTRQAFIIRAAELAGSNILTITREKMGSFLEPLTVEAYEKRGVLMETARSTKSRLLDLVSNIQAEHAKACVLLGLAGQDVALCDAAKAIDRNGILTVAHVQRILALTNGTAAHNAVKALKSATIPETPAHKVHKRKAAGKVTAGEADKGKETDKQEKRDGLTIAPAPVAPTAIPDNRVASGALFDAYAKLTADGARMNKARNTAKGLQSKGAALALDVALYIIAETFISAEA